MLLNRARAERVMDRHQVDGLVAGNVVNVRYLTDFDGITQRAWQWRSFAVLPRRTDRPPTLVVSGVELPRLARYPTWAPNIRVYGRPGAKANGRTTISSWATADPGAALTDMERLWEAIESDVETASASALEALRAAVGDAGLEHGRVGFDDLRVARYVAELGLTGIRPVEATNIFREIRMVKTLTEVELLRTAAKINEAAVLRAVGRIRPTRSWFEVENAWAADLCSQGGRPVYLSCGPAEMRYRTLALGDTVMIDGFASYRGYHADIGRTVVIGGPSREQRRKYEALRTGFHQVYRELRPGMTSHEITSKVLDAVRNAGLPKHTIVTPHCIGLEHTDHPHAFGNEPPDAHLPWLLEPGVTFNIDMPYLERGWGTLHLEDTLLSTEHGVDPLTSLRTELICV